jgi:hypothetical protein
MTDLTQTPQKTLEERLQPWIDQAEYLIPLVIGLMAYAAGWVDLLGFESPSNPVVFGRYSLPIFLVIVAYTLGFSVWFWLIGSLRALDRFKRLIAFIQRTPILYVAAWVVFIGLIWSMFNIDYWTRLPLLEVAVLIMMVLFTLVVLLAKPFPDSPFQTWRKVALILIGALILLEISLQGLAALKLLPFENTSGVTTPYGRVYQNVEGFGSGNTNRLGWYYPEFRLAPETRRVILSGDTFVGALQIPMEQHMGLRLESLLNENAETETEVLAQGQVGYGPSTFFNPIMSPYIWEPMQPDEIVVFFHLANDFQITDPAIDPRPRFQVGEDGLPVVVDEDFGWWHTLAHIAIAGHDPANPIRTVASNLMTAQLAMDAAENVGISLQRPEFPLLMEQRSESQPLGLGSFVFETAGSPEAEQALTLAAAQLRGFEAYMAERDIQVRLVTIPFFPEAFYTTNSGADWSEQIEQYDLLRPERYLQAAAAENNVSFLGMGQYLKGSGLTVETIQSLFLQNGVGHFTEAGHNLFAQAVYDCFYNPAGPLSSESGCVTTDEQQDDAT